MKETPVKNRYNTALAELPATLRGYVTPVMEALRLNGVTVNPDRIKSVKKGAVMDWQIMNAIRIYCGLEVVPEIKAPSPQEIAERLKLEMSE